MVGDVKIRQVGQTLLEYLVRRSLDEVECVEMGRYRVRRSDDCAVW